MLEEPTALLLFVVLVLLENSSEELLELILALLKLAVHQVVARFRFGRQRLHFHGLLQGPLFSGLDHGVDEVLLLDLFLKQALKLALLEIANQDLALLALRHGTELAELVVLEKSEGFQVRNPLFANLLEAALLPLAHSIFSILPPRQLEQAVIFLGLGHPVNAARLSQVFLKFLELLVLDVNKLRLLSLLQQPENVDSLHRHHVLNVSRGHRSSLACAHD